MLFNGRFLCAYATAVLVAFSPAIPSTITAQTKQIGKLSKTKISIDNFGQIDETYYRGAQPEGRDYADLAAFGIQTVIDLQADGNANEAKLVQVAGMKFFRIPMTTHEPPTQEKLAQFFSIVHDQANQPVYVHCKGGKHRTGVMTAVYRMTEYGWTADRAFQEMKKYGFGLDLLHPEFKKFVYAYDVPLEQPAPAAPAVLATQ